MYYRNLEHNLKITNLNSIELKKNIHVLIQSKEKLTLSLQLMIKASWKIESKNKINEIIKLNFMDMKEIELKKTKQ